MKIEGRTPHMYHPQKTRQPAVKTGTSFSDVLTRRSQDTITLSYPSADPPPDAPNTKSDLAPSAAAAGSAAAAVTIDPKDSVQTKLAKLRAVDERTDYSGMSYVDIFKSAWDRYNEAFGGNMFAIMSGIVEGEDWIDISNQFNDERIKNIICPIEKEIRQKQYAETGQLPDWSKVTSQAYEEYRQIRREALGYGDMTTSERRYVIAEKYAGKHTVLDFLNMQGELLYSGVTWDRMGACTTQYTDALSHQFRDFFFPETYRSGGRITQADYNSVLHRGFNARAFADALHEGLKGWDFGGTVAAMIESTVNESLEQFMSALDRPGDTQK